MSHKRRKTATLSVNGLSELETLEDRISDLPDSILAHILAKIPTKSAVGTAVLSTRWKHLFSQIPNPELSINDSHLLRPRHVYDTDMVDQRRYSNFVTFMNNLLSNHIRDVPQIRSFYLFLHRGYADDEMNAWISAVLAHNVPDLWVFCHAEHVGVLCDIVFRSASLVKLILCYINFAKGISSSVCLPNLKSLCLVDVTFENVDSLEGVIAACPMLESFSMCDCKFESPVRILRISSPSVRDAKLGMVSDCWSDGMYGLELDMPALESLHYEDHVPERYCVKNLSSVRRAYIQVGPSKKQMEDEVEKIWRRFKNIGDFVGSCSNVRSLYLSNLTVAVLNYLCHPMPAFHNLTELELSKIGSAGWELLPQFLESSPNLEILVFKGGFLSILIVFQNSGAVCRNMCRDV